MEKNSTAPTIRPLSFWETVFFFGLPTMLLVLSTYCLVPRLLTWGFSPYMSLDIAFLVPFALLFCASLIAYRMTSYVWTWATFKDRFRLCRMDGNDWFWTVGLFIFALVSYFPLRAITISQFLTEGIIALPDSLPTILDPRTKQSTELLMGGQVKGNWPLALVKRRKLWHRKRKRRKKC